ncbi:hypothetical protein FB567DRAFT_528323 [Paraphoma chrysanthemicola]|uniref:Zn(2)-C6 fungal-type domain-containing protein n=1 Tax=Paraphoma chrysanthemicola TaxID=798071 RepID=A0A8K0R5B9_9PLEO|nr:hypothetical protein FB567DRAFT_528323 [Paraphoma chrysanthemicola]
MSSTNQHVKGTRRHHTKSRTGCFECKRRRVKCDETRPACTKCVQGLEKCVYPISPRFAAKRDTTNINKSYLATDTFTPSPSSSPFSDHLTPPPFSYSTQNEPASIEGARPMPVIDPVIGLSNDDLYKYYVHQTSHSLSFSSADHTVLHQIIPALALHNSTVYHALLAVSAVHIAWTTISSQPPPDPAGVNKILLAGYRHYNSASERMRVAMFRSEIELEPLVASALLLVPFATASQQINHWISKNTGSGAREARKRLESTPRDVTVIMRGVRALLQSPDGCSPLAHKDCSPTLSAYSTTVQASVMALWSPTLSRTHFMISIIAKTSDVAFMRLRRHLEFCSSRYDQNDEEIAACRAAVEVLEHLKKAGLEAKPSTASPGAQSPEIATRASLQLSAPLRSFARHSFALSADSPQPTHALTRFFLTFLIRVPQSYFDFILPLLDQRLESPCLPIELTHAQALALDVYAHWSVLMFLVEKEGWWIGSLPEVTLEGMVNRYGEGFVKGAYGGNGEVDGGKEKWWPGWMLRTLKDARSFE